MDPTLPRAGPVARTLGVYTHHQRPSRAKVTTAGMWEQAPWLTGHHPDHSCAAAPESHRLPLSSSDRSEPPIRSSECGLVLGQPSRHALRNGQLAYARMANPMGKPRRHYNKRFANRHRSQDPGQPPVHPRNCRHVSRNLWMVSDQQFPFTDRPGRAGRQRR